MRAHALSPDHRSRTVPGRISDDLSEQIRDLIVDENLDEGARLPSERELAERFGASRPTISQALRRLSLMGMVEIRRGSGAYVLRRPQTMVTDSVNLMLDLDKRSIGDLMQLRLWLETVGAEQAAQRPVPLDAAEIVSLAGALTRIVDASTSASQWIAADTVFHAAIVGMAGNSYLTAFYESVHTAVLTWEYDEWLKHNTEPEWIHATAPEAHHRLHEPIMTSVIHRDPATARAAVAAHHQVMVEHLELARGPIGK
jgi:GntR family transcriptional regulator, transcriptional repressor for pyruvate dehydrogenase complex